MELPGSTPGVSTDTVHVDMSRIDQLYAAYMPFVTNGGLFIGARRMGDATYGLGSDIELLLRLDDHSDQLRVRGHVVWVTPASRGPNSAGVGVQFADDGEAQDRIERQLTGMLNSERPTLTL